MQLYLRCYRKTKENMKKKPKKNPKNQKNKNKKKPTTNAINQNKREY